MVDKKHVCYAKDAEVAVALPIAVFYIFYNEYPAGAVSVMEFMQT